MTKKILWHSNAPWAGVGYGVQTALFAQRIKEDLGYDIAISAFWGLGGSMQTWRGINVLPGDDNWGNRLLAAYAAWWGGGNTDDVLVITLMDVWVLKNQHLPDLHVASWVPVDHDPIPPKVELYFKKTGARPIAMSRFGEAKLREAGLDPLYVPHGVDTSIMRPVEDKAGVRAALGIPGDAFVIGMVANNQGFSPPRKAFPEVFEAFSRFRRKHKDAILYVHTEKTGVRQGLNLELLAQAFGIDDAVRFPPQTALEIGIPQATMAGVFSSFDVLVNTSYGEGFGIPIIEAQACGTPVIVTDYTAMPELCGAGWKVGGDKWYDAGHGAFFMRPSVQKITAAMERAYIGASKLREKARAFAVNYDADVVTERFWKPVLAELTAPSEEKVLEALR